MPWLALAFLATACSAPAPRPPSSAHLTETDTLRPTPGTPPPLVTQPLLLPPPKPGAAARTEVYSVVVNNVKVHDLLFALARDAKVNVDIHPGIAGTVTLNAIDQTLPQILARIARQVDLRWELDGPNLAVMPDTPFLRHYKVDYVNMSRDTSATVSLATQLATGAAVAGTATGTTAPAPGATSNNSLTRIENKAQNRFWETLIANVRDILRETDKLLPEGSSETVVEQAASQTTTGTGATPHAGTGRSLSATANAAAAGSIAASPNPASLQGNGTTVVRRSTFREAASVIAHPESGVVTVRATSRQHERIREFLDRVLASARRQVLIEATIAEVHLTENFRQGIDWSRLPLGSKGFTLQTPSATGFFAAGSRLAELAYRNPDSRLGGIAASISLLESFGTVKVLSSPKMSVLNNQSAILKVVDNQVFFTIKADTTQNQTSTVTTFTTTPNSVPVGIVMNVTPQIGDGDTVILNIRPSISRIIGQVRDPNPALKKSASNGFAEDIVSQIPVIRTREMESVLRIENGNIAVLGGLMEDSVDNQDEGIPGLHRLPGLGALFTNRNDATAKGELVIFLRPTIVRDASLAGDYAALREQLPGPAFLQGDTPRWQLAPATPLDGGQRP